MDELTQLAIKYKTDKWGKHHYTPIYYELFKDRREEVDAVLEIGVAEGQSLFMWRDFFPNAIIYGVDNDEKRVKSLEGLDRIRVIQADQSIDTDLKLISFFSGVVDLIVDDGSNKPEDQVKTCLALMQNVKENGVYVIEDVADETIASKLSKHDPVIEKYSNRYDDRTIICQK